MQTINHPLGYGSIHPIFNEIERFYALTSTKTLQSQNVFFKVSFDNAFETLQSLFNQYGGNAYNFNLVDKQYAKLPRVDYDDNNLILLFSGGKDSTATAVKYKNLGYNVYLFHVKGINKSYPDEWKSAQAIADYLELPIYYAQFESKGKLEFTEHPMKNMILANMAIEWGIKNNIGYKILCGNYILGDLNPSSFYINGDDISTMWDAYDKIVRKAIPDYYTLMGLRNPKETMTVLSKDMKLLGLCQSCLGAQRFRQWNHDNNEKKYGIKLLDNRCGSCWKCCVEYIYLADHDLLEYDEPYYIHCLDVIKKADKRENGESFVDAEYMWTGYFQYDIQKSKYKDIMNYGRHNKKCSQ